MTRLNRDTVTLSTEDADHFYRLMSGLQLFVSKVHHLLPEGHTLQEYATLGMNEKLRGGTAVQSAALGVLRASARAAQSAAQEPDDLEALRRLGRRVQTALHRLQTALDRAE